MSDRALAALLRILVELHGTFTCSFTMGRGKGQWVYFQICLPVGKRNEFEERAIALGVNFSLKAPPQISMPIPRSPGKKRELRGNHDALDLKEQGKIRTYDFVRGEIRDHRLPVNERKVVDGHDKLQRVMDGELDLIEGRESNG